MRQSGVRGGLNTKISIAVDALDNPVRFILTAGQVADLCQAGALTTGIWKTCSPTRATTEIGLVSIAEEHAQAVNASKPPGLHLTVI